MPQTPAPDLAQAIDRLRSLHSGDLGVAEVVACGSSAIPALRSLLFQRETSGLFETRCRAVDALAALGAFDVLLEYLNAGHSATDPVERLGDDAVINAAALAAAERRDERVFRILLRLADRACLTGVVRALGRFDRVEALPRLIDALEDDASRPAVETAIRRMGRRAISILVSAAKRQWPSSEHESETSLRRRRSALKLLSEIGVPRRIWPQLRPLTRDRDARISALACELGLARSTTAERRDLIARLTELAASADWMLRGEIEGCLASASAVEPHSSNAPD